MTAIGQSNLVNGYDVDKALSLLGPRNVFERDTEESRCCLLDCMWQLIQEIGQFICRTCNLICGDHQWYTNEMAREIVEQYCLGTERTPELDTKVYALYVELQRRSRGDGLYADGIDVSMLNRQENRVPTETPGSFESVIEESEEGGSDADGGTCLTSADTNSKAQIIDESNDAVIARIVAEDVENLQSSPIPIAMSQPSVGEQTALSSPVAALTFDQLVQDVLDTRVIIGDLYLSRSSKGTICYQLARVFQYVDKERAKELISEAINLSGDREVVKAIQLQVHLDTPQALQKAGCFSSSSKAKKLILREVAFVNIKDNPQEAIRIASLIGSPINQEVYHRLIKSYSQSTDLSEQKLIQLASLLNISDINDFVRARIARAQAKEELAVGLATAEGISDKLEKVKALCKIAEFATDDSGISALLDNAKAIAFAETDQNNKAVMLSTLAKACFKFQSPLYEDVESELTTCLQSSLSRDTLIQLVKDYASRDESKALSIINNKMQKFERNDGFSALALVKAKMGEDTEEVMSYLIYNHIEALCAMAKASPNQEMQKRLLKQAHERALQRRFNCDNMSTISLVAETFFELFGNREIG